MSNSRIATHSVRGQTDRRSRMNLYQAVLQAKLAGVGAALHCARAEIATGTGALEGLLRQLSGINNSGLVLSVDEAQSASGGDFTQLAVLLQRSVRLEAPLVSLIGGLPTLRSTTPSKSSVATRGGPHKTPGPSRSTTLTPRSHRPPPSSPGRSTLDDGRRPPAPNANISRDHRPRERALGQFSDRTALLSVFGLPPFGAT